MENLITIPNSELVICTDLSILKKPSRLTSFKEILKLNMFDRLQSAMAKAWTPGVGLAAIQLAIPIRFAFYRDVEKPLSPPRFLINPVILNASHCVPRREEGCLSLPEQRFNTWRYDHIVYQKMVNGRMDTFEARGFEAHVIQHECDHMDGILCCDRTKKPLLPGRNDMCPCNSGKKYKKCCEAKGVAP